MMKVGEQILEMFGIILAQNLTSCLFSKTSKIRIYETIL